jgi:hypothetical protein
MIRQRTLRLTLRRHDLRRLRLAVVRRVRPRQRLALSRVAWAAARAGHRGHAGDSPPAGVPGRRGRRGRAVSGAVRVLRFGRLRPWRCWQLDRDGAAVGRLGVEW